MTLQLSVAGDLLVKGQRYQVTWGDPERLPSGLVLDAGRFATGPGYIHHLEFPF